MSLRERITEYLWKWLLTYPRYKSDTTYIADGLNVDRELVWKELNQMHKEGLVKKSFIQHGRVTLARWGRKGTRWKLPDVTAKPDKSTKGVRKDG